MAATRDLTRGPIAWHIVAMSAPMLALLVVQAINYMIDLYFVAKLGDAAIAGMGMGSNAFVLTSALVQVLGVGTTTLISQAVGRGDRADIDLVFNQSIALSVLCGACVLLAGFCLTAPYVRSLAGDDEITAAGISYLYWLMPGLTLQFALPVITWGLRAFGIVYPPMVIYGTGILVNILFAPILILGWGTGHPMGVAGAGLANSLANLAAAILLWMYFHRRPLGLRLRPHQLRPDGSQWMRILKVGLPAGGETVLMFLYTTVVYWTIRDFGAAMQAGFSAGSRLLQIMLVPALAVSLAVAPIVGQNFGARNGPRVRTTFRCAVALTSAVMLCLTLLLQRTSEMLIQIFTAESDAVRAGTQFLELASLTFIGRGLIYACSGLFQGLGNTVPSLATSVLSLVSFAIPATLLSGRPEFRVEHLWYLWIGTVTLQATINVLLLLREFRRRLPEPVFHNQFDAVSTPAIERNSSTSS